MTDQSRNSTPDGVCPASGDHEGKNSPHTSPLPNPGRAIILLSGGLDSTTVLAVARSRGHAPYALSFSYGQRHQEELEACQRIARSGDVVEHRIINIDPVALSGSALTDPSLVVPKDAPADQVGSHGIPITYVPARNTVFLAYALAWAEVIDAGTIYIGVNARDFSGYPDCRPEFIHAFQELANAATRRGEEGAGYRVDAPLLYLTKADIIRLGTKLGVDYSITTSCYDPVDGLACGRCDACVLRRQGFEQAGIDDPTIYCTKASEA